MQPMNTDVQIWQHKTSGDQYVVTVDRDTGTVVRANGPLHHRETASALINGVINDDPELVDDLNADRESYTLAYDEHDLMSS